MLVGKIEQEVRHPRRGALIEQLLDARLEPPEAQAHDFRDLVAEGGAFLNELTHDRLIHRADDRRLEGLCGVIARTVVDDGELAEDVAGGEQGERQFATVGPARGDLHRARLQQIDLIAGVALHVDPIAARDLEHARHLMDALLLGVGQHVEELEVL